MSKHCSTYRQIWTNLNDQNCSMLFQNYKLLLRHVETNLQQIQKNKSVRCTSDIILGFSSLQNWDIALMQGWWILYVIPRPRVRSNTISIMLSFISEVECMQILFTFIRYRFFHCLWILRVYTCYSVLSGNKKGDFILFW